MSWWTPKRLTAEDILAQAEADARSARDTPVVYHRDQAKIWRRHEWSLYALIATMIFFAALLNVQVLTVFYIVLACWVGTQVGDCRRRRRVAQIEAWKVENEETLNGLHQAGFLAGPRSILEVMREAEPPPGVSRKDWIAEHNDLLRQWDEQHGT